MYPHRYNNNPYIFLSINEYIVTKIQKQEEHKVNFEPNMFEIQLGRERGYPWDHPGNAPNVCSFMVIQHIIYLS